MVPSLTSSSLLSSSKASLCIFKYTVYYHFCFSTSLFIVALTQSNTKGSPSLRQSSMVGFNEPQSHLQCQKTIFLVCYFLFFFAFYNWHNRAEKKWFWTLQSLGTKAFKLSLLVEDKVRLPNSLLLWFFLKVDNDLFIDCLLWWRKYEIRFVLNCKYSIGS